MIPSPVVSIIIVSWNALETIRKCLPSVVATDFPSFEIIFADNASTDGSGDWIRQHFPHVRVVRHPQNWAFCRGNNEAIRHARGQILVLLNNDVEVPPDWLAPLVSYLKHHPETGAVGPRILDYWQRDRFEYAGAAGGFMDRLGYPFARGRIFFDVEADFGQYDDARPVFWASGTCLAVRRSLWEESGGFDERFFMHMEEIDLCWRLQRMGHRIAVEPASRVYHMGGASLEQGHPRKTFLNYRNNLLLLLRNLPTGSWPGVFIQRLVLDGLAVFRSLVTLNPAEAWAIVRAYAAAHAMKRGTVRGPRLPDARSGRGNRPTSPEDPSPEEGVASAADEIAVPLPYRGSVVWDYFIRGRKKFSLLPVHRFRL